MPTTIDLNRGVTKRTNGRTTVIMYKDEPGVFYAPNGSLVDPAVAAAVGFPVEDLVLERKRKAAVAAAIADINKRFQRERFKVEQAAAAGELDNVEGAQDAPAADNDAQKGELRQVGVKQFEVSL